MSQARAEVASRASQLKLGMMLPCCSCCGGRTLEIRAPGVDEYVCFRKLICTNTQLSRLTDPTRRCVTPYTQMLKAMH